MPVQLLPASAAAFAPRASVNVVLGSKIEPWLTQTLKRINRVKRPLNSVPQHQRCLTETLSSPNAIWTLTSLMLPKTPECEFKRDAANPLVEAIMNYELVHVEAYIVHVDMVLRNEVAFKLTKDSIEALVEYHKEIHCVDAKANTYDWTDKEQQCKKLHEDFVQDINKFVFRTHVSALEGLEEEGAGELLCGKSEEVKNNISALMKPLLPPPPPRVIEVVRQPTLLPSSPAHSMWSQPSYHGNLAAVDSWQVLPSSPSVTSSADSNTSPIWAPMTMSDLSPTPAFTQPHSTAGFYWSSPPVTAPIPALPLPSMLAPAQCGIGMGMGGMGGMGNMGSMGSMGGMSGFGWDRYQEYATIM
ncbi:hypothetical protein NXS19_011927 [Fusarium pseudograminearum]|nr:hypothetical protein NXS19_011927 [Fusarium pseudograminearum]